MSRMTPEHDSTSREAVAQFTRAAEPWTDRRSTRRRRAGFTWPADAICLHHLIEEQVWRTPSATAVVCEDQRLSYLELHRRAEALAHHLQMRGVGPDVVVGLFVERSIGMIVGLLAVLKAGGAYLPIDAVYPTDRVRFMLDDARVPVVLTETPLVPTLAGAAADVICLDTFTGTGRRADEAEAVRAHHLAYVIYTSGSTGRPKGVAVEHRNVVSYVLAVTDRLRLTPGLHHATVSTLAADLGNTVVFPALVSGGCLHVITHDRAVHAARLAEYFEREQIDVLKIVPSHLAALQAGRDAAAVMPKARLILGGEASRLDWVARLRALAPGCEIFNHYGPTETTVGVLTLHVEGDLPATPSGTLPLGTPLANSRVYLLDDARRPVAPGDAGELYIGGEGVARGYLNRPELTAERFVTDPFSEDPGARMYRTGDVARMLPDGTIEFVGRLDHQVKIHGYRVELGEIEHALRDQPGVREALVVARSGDGGTTDVVAYVVPDRRDQPLWDRPAIHVLPDGAPVAHLNRNETDYIYNEVFVLQAYLRHGITIRDGDCILDAGANIGLFTVFASRLAADLRIVAFEPNPSAYACLQANAHAWGADVTCLPIGLSDAERTADLTFFEGMSLLSGFYADAQKEKDVVRNYVFNQDETAAADARLAAEVSELIDGRLRARQETARLRRLSDVIAELGIGRVDLLKVNVEKSELDVLRGIDAGDWPKIRQLVVEIDLAANVEPIRALLAGLGYEVLVEQDPLLRRTELCYIYAIRPSALARLIQEQPDEAYLRQLPAPAGGVLTPTTLRRALARRLPPYMVPSAFVRLDAFPLNANGKIDRSALPAPVSVGDHAAPPAERALTDTERQLAALWAEALRVDRIGPDDNFFELGGHSLLAIRLVTRISDAFGVDVQLRNLFEWPTLAALAAIIDGLLWLGTGGADPAGPVEEEMDL